MRPETSYLLVGFNPIASEKKHLFWKTWDERKIEIEQKKYYDDCCLDGNWQRVFEQILLNWRELDYFDNLYGNSKPINVYLELSYGYPEPIPYCLFFTYTSSEEAKEMKWIGDLGDKWLIDILSGESFFERNKEYFSRTEAKQCCTCDWAKMERDPRRENSVKSNHYMDLIEYYFDSKIKANNLNIDAFVFTRSFGVTFLDRIVQDFFRFISNNKNNIKEAYDVSDICDYLKNEYIDKGVEFDFNNRTWRNLKRLSDEWHLENRMTKDYDFKKYINSKWKKSEINDYSYEDCGNIWTIIEITTGKLLYEEGQDMHHCCFSYVNNCINNNCMIFSVKCIQKNEENNKRIATIEITKDKRLIQARGKYNKLIDSPTENIIKLWANENGIDLKNVYENIDYYLEDQ
jgi:hypothetical protein